MKTLLLIMLLIVQLAFVPKIYAQNIAINGTGNLPDTSAMLDVSSTNKGFLAPRVTTTQQNAIPLPANGLLIFNITENTFKVNTGTTLAPVWTSLTMGSGITTNTLSSSVNTMTNTTNGVVATAPIINSNGLALTGNDITSTVNGVVSTALNLPFIRSLNGLAGASQLFAVGTSGNDFDISSSGATHTFNLPTASASKRGALSSGDWSVFNAKQAALVSGTTIKTVNSNSLLGSGDLMVEPVITSPNSIRRYLNGYKQFVSFNTDSITEGAGNLYYTNTRARAAISLTTTGTSGAATYNNVTGVLNVPSYATGWQLGGNSGITQPATPTSYGSTAIGASENFLGTKDAKDLVLGTNNLERMRILNSNGYLGIGTSVPDKPLVLISNIANVGLVRLQNTNITGYSSIDFWNTTTQVGNIGFSNGAAIYPNSFYFATNATHNMVFGTNNIERLRIDGITGFVAIDTTTANSPLFINGPLATIITTITNNNVTLADTHSTVIISTGGTNRTVFLPTAIGIAGRIYTIKKNGTGGGNVTLDGFGSQAIDNSTTYTMSSQWKYVTIQSDGANWMIIANN